MVPVAGLARPVRVRWGRAPVLSLRPERVRWSAGRDVGRERGSFAPDVVAGTVHADREIEHEAAAGGSGPVGRLGQLLRRHPLDVQVVARAIVLERAARERAVPLRVGPGAPPRPAPFDLGTEPRVVGGAWVPRELGETGGRRPSERLLREGVEDRPLRRRRGRMIREVGLAQPRDPFAEGRIVQRLTCCVGPLEAGCPGDVDVGLVPEQAARGRVGARLEHRLVEELGEQREGRRRRSAQVFDPTPQIAEVGEAADPPVVLGAERVERSEDPPPPAGRPRALPRCRQDERLHHRSLAVEPQGVPSCRKPAADRDARGDGSRLLGTRHGRRGFIPSVGVLAFGCEPEAEGASGARRRNAHVDLAHPSAPCDDHRLDPPVGELLPAGSKRRRRIRERRDRGAHRPEHGDHAVHARVHAFPVHVPVALLDVVQTSELPQHPAVVGHGPSSSRSRRPRTGTGSQSGRLSSS